MATESQICKDWVVEFPFLARFKSGRRLLRVQTPIIFGIELEKFTSEAYRPKFVALNLLSSFPEFAISRTLATKRRPQLSVAYSKHEIAFEEAVEVMRETFPILARDGILSEESLIDIYRLEIKTILKESASPLAVWFSLIQLLTFFGQDAEAFSERARLESYVKTLNPQSLAAFGDFEALLERELSATTDELEKRRCENIAKGKWEILPGM